MNSKTEKHSQFFNYDLLSCDEEDNADVILFAIRNSMQQDHPKVQSILYNECVLFPDDEWKKLLKPEELKLVKIIFKPLFGTAFEDYEKEFVSDDYKIEMVHSKLKSMYREEKSFVKTMKNMINAF